MQISAKKLVVGMLILGLLCGVVFIFAACETAGPSLARGVPITNNGYAALISSALGFFGLTAGSVVTAIFSRLHITLPGGTPPEQAVDQIIELSASFTALMSAKTNIAAQRRFIFALADAARLITGCNVSHDGGVLRIEYSGFVTPTVPSPAPAPSAPPAPAPPLVATI